MASGYLGPGRGAHLGSRQSIGAAATIARHVPGGHDLLAVASTAFVHGADAGAWIAAAVALAAVPLAVTRLPRRA